MSKRGPQLPRIQPVGRADAQPAASAPGRRPGLRHARNNRACLGELAADRLGRLGGLPGAGSPKDKPGDAFSAPPGLTASSKMGRTGEYAPPSRRLQHDLY